MTVVTTNVLGVQVCRPQRDWSDGPYLLRIAGDGIWDAVSVWRPGGAARTQLLTALALPDVPPGSDSGRIGTCVPVNPVTVEVTVSTRAGPVTRYALFPRSNSRCPVPRTEVLVALEKLPPYPATLIPTTRLLSEGATDTSCQAQYGEAFGAQYDHTVVGPAPALPSGTVGICVYSIAHGDLARFGQVAAGRVRAILSTGLSPPQERCPPSPVLTVGALPATPGSRPQLTVERQGCRRIRDNGRVIGHLSADQVRAVEALATGPEQR